MVEVVMSPSCPVTLYINTLETSIYSWCALYIIICQNKFSLVATCLTFSWSTLTFAAIHRVSYGLTQPEFGLRFCNLWGYREDLLHLEFYLFIYFYYCLALPQIKSLAHGSSKKEDIKGLTAKGKLSAMESGDFLIKCSSHSNTLLSKSKTIFHTCLPTLPSKIIIETSS